MKYTLSILTALLLLGCGDTQQTSNSEAESSTVREKTALKAETKPAGLQKTVAPKLVHPEKPAQDTQVPKEEIVQKSDETKTQIAQTTEKAAADGAVIFKKCASCHGQKAEKSALGKSQIIAGWDTAKLNEALLGYKNGSYGGAMKALMQSQVRNLGDQEIKAVTEYISSL
jgi:cytochrome c553